MKDEIIDMCRNTMDRFEFKNFESNNKANFTCKYTVKDKLYKEYVVNYNNKIYDVRHILTNKNSQYIINER